MKFHKGDLRKIFRDITDSYCINDNCNDVEGLTRREYFDKMWNLMNKEFYIDTSSELFQIKCRKDKETNTHFLWQFILLNSSVDLKFSINNLEDKSNISIFKKELNKQKLRAIMDFMYKNTIPYQH